MKIDHLRKFKKLKLPTTYDMSHLTFCLYGAYDGDIESGGRCMYRYPFLHSYPYRVSLPPSFPHWPYHTGAGWHPYHQPPMQWTTGQHVGAPYMTSYPKPNPVLKPPTSGLPSIMSQFKTSDGTYDINKMMNTMGQMINTVNQVNGVLKGLISTFKK